MGFKDIYPRKSKRVNNLIKYMNVLEKVQNLTPRKNIKENKTTEDNNETSINYVVIGKN